MSKIDDLKDKYWLKFIVSQEGDLSEWKQLDAAFWFWFYHEKMKKGSKELEDYL